MSVPVSSSCCRGTSRWHSVRRYTGLLAAVIAAAPRVAVAQPAEPAWAEPESAAQAEDSELDVEAALVRAVAYYETGRYRHCVDAFSALLDTSPTPVKSARALERARIYYAACLIAVGRRSDADEQIREAIRENPQMAVPDSVVFPQVLVDRFIVIRTSLLDEIRAYEELKAQKAREEAEAARRRAEADQRRVAELERLASRETLVVKNSRWVASVPFGVGQFQNRDYVLGAIFLATELALAATAITATSIELHLHGQAQRIQQRAEADALNANIRTARTVSLAATGGLLFTAAVGVAHAHMTYVPELDGGSRARRASRPPKKSKLSVSPVAAVAGSGGFVGLAGSF